MDKKNAQKAVGKRIRAARLGADINQTELSIAIGGPDNARRISQLETGERPAKIEELQKLGKLFGVPWSQLLHGNDHDKADKTTDLVDSIYTGPSDKWITVPLHSAGAGHEVVDRVPVLRAELIKMGATNLNNVCVWEHEGKLLFIDLTPRAINFKVKRYEALAQVTMLGTYCHKI